MPTIRIATPDGTAYNLTPPDNATPEEMQNVVNAVIAQHQQKAGVASSGVGNILWDEAKNLPANIASDLASKVRSVWETVKAPPSMSTALPLVVGGPASTVATRLGAFAAGKMLDNPSSDPIQNLKTAVQGVVGDWSNPWSVATSPAVAEATLPVMGKLLRSLPGAQQRIASEYTNGLGERLEDATGGVIRNIRTPEQFDALVYGQQGVGGKLKTGQRTLGAFYARRVADANKAIGGREVSVPALSEAPMSLDKAVHDIQNIAASQSGANPAGRTVVGRSARELRQTAWEELEQSVSVLDPSGTAIKALRDGRNRFGVGMAFIDAIKKSGAIISRPNEISFDSGKFQQYVSANRGKFIERFDAMGIPGAWPQLVQMVYRGGPVGTTDVASRNVAGVADAASQLLRSGGGAGTTAVLPIRTSLPGLGNRYTGTSPFSVSPGTQTLTDVGFSATGKRRDNDPLGIREPAR